MTEDKPRYCVYARVSSEPQAAEDKISISEQLEYCHNWAKASGLITSKHPEYIEPGVTGETFEGRPALMQMLEAAKRREFDVLVVRFGSRLSRMVHITATIFNQLTDAGVQLRALNYDSSPPDNPNEYRAKGKRADSRGLIMATLSGLTAQLEQSERVERLVGARRRYVRDGSRLIQGKPPFGYKLELKQHGAKVVRQAVPDPATYPLIQELPRLVLEEFLSDRAIAERWNRQGYRTTEGAVFTGSTISRLRKTRFYMGEQTFGVRKADGTINPPQNVSVGPHNFQTPWSREQFEAMQAFKTKRARQGGRSTSGHSPLAGVLRCGYCGHTMDLKGTTNRKGEFLTSRTFSCWWYYASGTECRSNNWSSKIVWKCISEELDAFARRETTKTAPEGELPASSPDSTLAQSIRQRIAQEEKELATFSERRKVVNRLVQKGIITDEEYQTQLEELRRERTETETRLEALREDLARAVFEAGREYRSYTLAQGWISIRQEIAKYHSLSNWPTELIHKVRYDIIQPVFSKITIEADPTLQRTTKYASKGIPLLKFEYR